MRCWDMGLPLWHIRSIPFECTPACPSFEQTIPSFRYSYCERTDVTTSISQAPEASLIRPLLLALAAFPMALNPPPLASGARWARIMGGPGYERIVYPVQMDDGGCAFLGGLSENGIDSWIPWVVLLDASGETVWQRKYSGGDIRVTSAQQTKDGGFILAGETPSFGAGDYDGWCMKLNSSGDVEWQRTYGGSTQDVAMAIQETPDGGYVVVGYTYPFNNPLHPNGWCFKLDAEGQAVWSRAYAGPSGNFLTSVQQTPDDGYVAGGITFSAGLGLSDAWVLKLDSSGSPLWQKAYGGTSMDSGFQVLRSTDGGYITWGFTRSLATGEDQAWLMNLDAQGDIRWQRCYGGAQISSYAHAVGQAADGSYVVAGASSPVGTGTAEGWCLAVDSGGTVLWKRKYAAGLSTALSRLAKKSDGGYLLVGANTVSEGAGRDILVMSASGTGRIDPSCDGIGYGHPTLKATESNAVAAEFSAAVLNGPAQTSRTGLVSENTTTSNTPICSSPDQPELTAAWHGVWREGDTASGCLVCQNTGLRAARPFRVRVVLSADRSPDRTDTLVLMQTITSLAAGAEARPIRIDVSEDGPLAGKYLIAIVDSGSAITEENELNNKVARRIP